MSFPSDFPGLSWRYLFCINLKGNVPLGKECLEVETNKIIFLQGIFGRLVSNEKAVFLSEDTCQERFKAFPTRLDRFSKGYLKKKQFSHMN